MPHYARYLTDRTGELSLRDLEKLRALLRLFEQKFPQLLLSVHVVHVVPHASISEYAFWLINRARFSPLAATGPKNFDLLLVIDPQRRTGALIAGYGLENYLSEEDLRETLAAGGESFRAGDLAQSIRDCVEFMVQRLREICLRIENEKKTEVSASATQDVF